MTYLPSFPKIRRYALWISFFGVCFFLGLMKRILA